MTSKTETTTGNDGLAVIGGVALLLQAAADRCLSILAADPQPGLEESFALSDLGLGATFAASQARGLLPAAVEHDDIQPSVSRPDRGDPLELVQAAEALTRTVPIEALPVGGSRVVVALCDLLGEHG
ncbi:hypothetical protein [Terrabacter sp. Ter38]|uniref:hypothetical protein n=1 Tax=Terrabacter sp. Ter38 TaxID=2926030 RepID=UPI00211942D6|nr:hypothetical protein [Terrabacter sp. Ter38]